MEASHTPASLPLTNAVTPLRRIIGCEVLAEGGLSHCTSVPAFRRILSDGHLRPALETGAPARGAGVASLCRRLGAVCLFDVLPKSEAARLQVSNPGRAWLGSWLKIAKPVTVVIHLDKARLRAHGSALLSCAEARSFGSGVMLSGEVCHRGAIPLDACALGFLFVRRAGRKGLIGEYVAGRTLTKTDIKDALARLHGAWLVRAQAGRAKNHE
jgi:hypothetical protein